MVTAYFHRWEQRLCDISRNERVIRPFEWGVDWLPHEDRRAEQPPIELVRSWVDSIMQDTDAFFTPEPTTDYTFTPGSAEDIAGGEAGLLTFPSALTTPHPENNIVHARLFPAKDKHRAIVVMPQWNSDAGGHIGLSRLLARVGITCLRISNPYHDMRMPPELTRADYIVSSNVVRTLQVCRQAVLDTRRALWWLRDQGYENLGLLGTSLGSCLSMLTASHEPLVKAQALNHVSPFFADVVWRGLSTAHVREGLDGHIDLETLRELWRPISPWSYLDRHRTRKTLLVYAKYDLTFPVDLSRQFVDEFRRLGLPTEVAVLPCGHYTTGFAPFKYLDAYYLARFLRRNL
ncbi:MAG TPA: alpha/beta hydrolase family protein [Vicinamibacterales bacterium]|nr:alpha/beta hydrolase family protein [Vicinamibacterales bacterium]